MEIRCTVVENYKLTLGNIYEVHNESRDFYTIINDNGVGVRYAKRLFEEVQEVVVPPAPPARTEADMIASITFNTVNSRVQFVDLENTLRTVDNRFSQTGSNISCGVAETSGINNQIVTIDQLFDLDEDDYLEIRKALFKRCIEEYAINRRQAGNRIMTIMSTNVSGRDGGAEADEDMLSVLDELAHRTSDTMENPNSHRNIKVWVMIYNR